MPVAGGHDRHPARGRSHRHLGLTHRRPMRGVSHRRPGLSHKRPWPISAWTWAAAPAPAQAEPSSWKMCLPAGALSAVVAGELVSVTAGGGPGGGAGGPPKFPGRGDDGLADVLGVDSGATLDEDATAPLDVWNSWRTSASWGSAETSGGTLCGSVQGRHGSRESTMAWTCPGCSAENTPMNHAHRILTRQRQLKNA